ncbi:hypothetical protein D3C78_1223340 [compost metagenome]
MARLASPMKQTRTRHSQTYKDEALALAERSGVSKAAKQLGLHASRLYTRMVIGWGMGERMTADLVCDACAWRYGDASGPRV